MGVEQGLGGKMEILSKTILSVYRYLEALSNAIDNLVLKKSINSAFYNNGRYSSAYESAKAVMELTERKVNLINLKVLTEDCLMELDGLQRKVLTLIFIDNVKNENVCDILEISTRTFFRKKSDGLESFQKSLIRKGYSKQKLLSMFKNEKWLINLYLKNGGDLEGENKIFYKDTKDFNFINNIVRNYDISSVKAN